MEKVIYMYIYYLLLEKITDTYIDVVIGEIGNDNSNGNTSNIC